MHVVIESISSTYEQDIKVNKTLKSKEEGIKVLKSLLEEAVKDEDFKGIFEYGVEDFDENFNLIDDPEVNLLDRIEEEEMLTLFFMKAPYGIKTEIFKVLEIEEA